MSTNLRIVISANTAWNLYNFRSNIIRALVARGVEVIAVAPPDPKYQSLLEEIGCSFEPLKMDGRGLSVFNNLRVLLGYIKIIRRINPDFYMGYTIKPNIFGSIAAFQRGVSVINNISGLGTAFIRENWLTTAVGILYRASLFRSRAVFFQNSDDLDLFVKRGLVRRSQARLLPGSGVDLEHFSPPDSVLRSQNDGPIFLLVARLLWDKGVAEYVDAARLIRLKLPSARFQLLGFLGVENPTAVPRSAVDAWVDEGLIEYLGAVDDVRPFMRRADCIVLPSYREGTPRSLLEAAAMAKPLIATDVPGCREVIDHGINGYLCAVRNADDLADRMLEFACQSRARMEEMGSAGRAKMEREFDQAVVTNAYVKEIFGVHPVLTG